MKQKFLTLILVLTVGIGTLSASNTSVGGIYYSFNSNTLTATVSYRGTSSDEYNGEYSGTINIPSSVEYKGLTYKVTSIGNDAFYYCRNLQSVTIPSSVTSIGEDAFRYCTSLTSITIPNSVTSIGPWAFYNCNKMTSVTLSDNLQSIETQTFCDCTSLTNIVIPNSVTSIGEKAFYNCSNLTSVTFGENLTTIGTSAFSGCAKLESIIIPNNVTKIESSAFYGCSKATTVTIGSSVTSIGNSAFNGCGVTKFILLPSTPPSLGTDPFFSEPLCYIPCGSYQKYATSVWRRHCFEFVEQESMYNLALSSNNGALGQAKISSRPDCTTAIITAIPAEGCTFVKWSDGNTQATRYLELTEDINLTAYFAKEGYTIHVYQDCNTTIE